MPMANYGKVGLDLIFLRCEMNKHISNIFMHANGQLWQSMFIFVFLLLPRCEMYKHISNLFMNANGQLWQSRFSFNIYQISDV